MVEKNEDKNKKQTKAFVDGPMLLCCANRPVSGASMNPARSVGPALVSGEYRSIWVYVVGPVVGAVAGAWAYNLIRFTNKPLREITKSTSFLKSMNRMNSASA
jgi:aquaporin NIP